MLPKESMPREKLLNQGPQSLTDAELLAIFLRTGCRGVSVLQLADHVLKEFGSLRALFAASPAAFCHHRGLGTAKYVQLQAAMEMTQRFLNEGLARGETLTHLAQTKSYISLKLRGQHREIFYTLFLDSHYRLIHDEALFSGTLDASSVYPREVVKKALEYNAAYLILAHNHPSGVAQPSQADRRITQRIGDALAMVDIRLLDHFVVGDDEVVSFSEYGWI
ncbi:RadC family protein [Vibrio ostreicida]|uniref:RadC family protein n=1 Tax=Vibrio ostreicida TaxID=526588 RepID=UPI000970ACF4|nr:DNA repair protein RadC [Vibrio ostreicida]